MILPNAHPPLHPTTYYGTNKYTFRMFCSLESNDILLHHLFSCIKVGNHKSLLRSKLTLYNFPPEKLTDQINFLPTVLKRKIWTKCFSEFLAEVDGNRVHYGMVQLYCHIQENSIEPYGHITGSAEMQFIY